MDMIRLFGIGITILLLITGLNALEIITQEGDVNYFSLTKLRQESLHSFQTVREKDGKHNSELWEGIELNPWLQRNRFIEYQSIRFESPDNYMVRFHKAELDTMQGFIALRRNGDWLDSLQVRLIFPGQRDMYWVRGLSTVWLEDFKVMPPPRQIFIWDAISSKLELKSNQKPLVNVSGFLFDDIMDQIFHSAEGSVIMVARDGIKTRLEFPRHLGKAMLERTPDGTLNLRSHIIPSGMWVKDIVYIQSGPYAVIRHDFLYQLPKLYTLLSWTGLKPADHILRASVSKKQLALDDIYLSETPPFTAEDWIELP